MASGRTTHRTLRTAIALVLTYLMVWGGIPVPALAEMAEGGASPSGQSAQGGRSEGDDGGATSEPAAPDGTAEAPDGAAAPASPAADSDGPDSDRPTDEPEVTELAAVPERRSSSAEGDGRSGEELFEAYAQQRLEEPLGRPGQGGLLSTQSAESSLEGIDLVAFGKLKALVGEVASGSRASARLTIPVSQLSSDLGPWTASELGVASVVEDGQIARAAAEAAAERVSFDLGRVVHALLADCPYELYWYDKTAGTGYTPCEVSATWSGGEWRIGCAGDAVVEMRVSADFSATGDAGTTDVDPGVASAGGAVSTAVERAGQVVGDNAGKAALERLAAYRDAICSEAAYDGEAPKGAAYGSPWQLVWVFDGDPDTDVVCEGYSKALKYLCDLTWPGEDPDVECLLATGTMGGGTGAGDHMWNVVRMDDGRSYLVDVTNCDEGTVGAPDELFMAYDKDGERGSYADGYAFDMGGGNSVSYAYDEDTKAAFGEGALTLSQKAYGEPETRKVDVPQPTGGLVYDGTEQVGVEAGEGYTLAGDKATNAGDHKATATLAEGWEWSDGTTVPKNVDWTIARKPVTVTADNKWKVMGEADPDLTATVDGTVGEDAVSYELIRETGETAGEYRIVPYGDSEQGNYAVHFVSGVLTIVKPLIAEGKWGTCPWQIDGNGLLTVWPGIGEDSITLASPWDEYAKSITAVRFISENGQMVRSPKRGTYYLFARLSKATSIDLTGFDTSLSEDMEAMFLDCSSLETLDLSSLEVSKVLDMRSMFDGCTSLTELNLAGWDVSGVSASRIKYIFNGCTSVTSLDLSNWSLGDGLPEFRYELTSIIELSIRNWKLGETAPLFTGLSTLERIDLSGLDTSRVKSMSGMFWGCSALESLDISSFNTSNVSDMSGMFSGCSSLCSLDLSGLETGQVTNMASMFSGCRSLETIDVSRFNTANVTNMARMFKDCGSVMVLDVSDFDTSKVTNMMEMFFNCKLLITLDVSEFDTSEVTNTSRMFYNCWTSALDVSQWNTSKVVNMSYMFASCSKLEELNLSQWNTSSALYIDSMFLGCESLESVGDISRWDVSHVVSVDTMFCRCRSLLSLDLSKWDVSSITSMYNVFANCSSLTSVGDLSNWNTSKVRYSGPGSPYLGMISMFSGCSSLKSLNLSGWDTCHPIGMFSGCTSLESLDLSNWHVSGELYGIFEGCSSLTVLDLSSWSSYDCGSSIEWAFNGCSSLKKLDISSWSGKSVKRTTDAFAGCTSLEQITIGEMLLYKKWSSLLPAATSGNDKWWSYSSQEWYTCDEIASNRYNIADTYTNYELIRMTDIAGASVTNIDSSYPYQGINIMPEPVVDLGPKRLQNGIDYTLSYLTNRNAGSALVIIEGTGSYYGRVICSFDITKASLIVRAQDHVITYGDAPSNDGVVFEGLVGNDTAASLGGALQYAYNYNQYDAAGNTYTITPSGLTSDNYDITFEPSTLTVNPKPVELTWANTSFTYDASSHVPTATAGGLVNDDTATVSVVGAQTNAGTYIATAASVSNSNYCVPEANTREFTIAKVSISPTVSIVGWTYGGAAHEPVTTGNLGEGAVAYNYGRKGSSIIEYSSNVPTEAGDYVVRATVAETANYLSGVAENDFTIGKAVSAVSTAPVANTLAHTGEPQALVSTGVAVGGSMCYSVDDKTTWSEDVPKATDAGEYKVWYKVIGNANHLNSEAAGPIEVTIAKAKNGLSVDDTVVVAMRGTLDLSGLVSGADGVLAYAITDSLEGCSLDENTKLFKAGEKAGTCEVTVSAAGDANHDSATKVLHVTVLPSLGDAMLADIPAQTYTGKALTPKPKVTMGGRTLVAGTDYTLSYKDNVNAGTATVTVTGKGGYTGTKTATFKIAAADIGGATLSAIPAQTYTGSAITPKPKVTLGGRALREGTDYALSYRNNVNAGTATVTVTGRGNYTGSRSVSFKIAAKTFPDVPAGAWYANVVSRATGLGLMSGYADGRFGPNDRITRGQVAVVLWNMAGSPAAGSGARTFPDVRTGDYFYRAVRWASSRGVVSGYANGRFGPSDNVTREQLAVMLANYSARVAGRPASGSASDYALMLDRASVSPWAVPAVGWCFRNGILSGSGGRVLPQGSATRAEAAKMVVGLHDLLA